MEKGHYKESGPVIHKTVFFVAECEELYGIKTVYHKRISIHTLKRLKSSCAASKYRKESYSYTESDGGKHSYKNPWNSWINIWRN